jgi:DNA-binding beta-propeller fold protein YncE
MRLGSALAAVVVAGAVASGCGLNQQGIAPPKDEIFYPGAIAIDPVAKSAVDLTKPRWLYVLNSNADLRFNDGTLVVVDLDLVQAAYASSIPDKDAGGPAAVPRDLCPDSKFFNPLTSSSQYCCWDALDRNVLNCDERQFINTGASVRLGSFGSALAIDTDPSQYAIGTSATARRLYAAVRGNAAITWLDLNDQGSSVSVQCSDSTSPGAFAECDNAHRVNLTTDPNRPIEEPYAMAIDPTQGLMYVGHLRGGYLSSIDLAAADHRPALINVNPGIFPGDINGSTGVTSLTVTATGINSGRIYATSRYIARAAAFAPISKGQNGAPVDNPDTFLANAGDLFVSPLGGSEIRGIQPIPLTGRTYVLQRNPPALIGFDTTIGQNQNTATDIIEMCTGPTFLYMDPPLRPDGVDKDTGKLLKDTDTNKLLFVNCFEAGQVYVVDPYAARILAIIEVGRGPAGLALPPADPGKDHPDFAYVVGFGSNNVSVIDLQPGHTQYHVIQRIGFPDPVPR